MLASRRPCCGWYWQSAPITKYCAARRGPRFRCQREIGVIKAGDYWSEYDYIIIAGLPPYLNKFYRYQISWPRIQVSWLLRPRMAGVRERVSIGSRTRNQRAYGISGYRASLLIHRPQNGPARYFRPLMRTSGSKQVSPSFRRHTSVRFIVSPRHLRPPPPARPYAAATFHSRVYCARDKWAYFTHVRYTPLTTAAMRQAVATTLHTEMLPL